ncbi:MAG TPA: redoxin domain-containing protein, partial [Candidatus Sulfotelmatobacter sp.]|nr:redoxin domain-containing protein [Candidatus Sulfotelmatobacter sp.]
MRLSTLVGLLVGLVVGAVVLGTVALSLGSTTIQPSTSPIAAASPSPSPSAVASPTPSPSASPTAALPTPSGPTAVPTPTIAVGLKVGQQAPGLTVPKVGGGTVDLASLRGKPVWLAFTASWCPSCRDEMSLM